MAKIVKKRHWAFVVYPESAPEDWRDQLIQSGLRCAVSPLHDKDVDPTGDAKKPHWHVIACWDGPAAYSVAKAFTDRLNAPAPQALESVKGYYRYLTHKDNPDKYQYDDADIDHIGGFSPDDYIEWTRSELERLKRQVMVVIKTSKIYEYADLLELLDDSDADDLLSVAMNHTLLFKGYIDSRRARRSAEQERRMAAAERREAADEAAYNRDEIYGKREEDGEV